MLSTPTLPTTIKTYLAAIEDAVAVSGNQELAERIYCLVKKTRKEIVKISK